MHLKINKYTLYSVQQQRYIGPIADCGPSDPGTHFVSIRKVSLLVYAAAAAVDADALGNLLIRN